MKQMKNIIALLSVLLLLLSGCQTQGKTADIAATTLPVYEFTLQLCQGTDLTVAQLVTESVSCLHDYALNVGQVKTVEGAKLVVISGAGLEEFMEDLLQDKQIVDASENIALLESCHAHEHHEEHSHHSEKDAHIWLSPENAGIMAENICQGLIAQYPQHRATFEKNLAALQQKLQELIAYGKAELSNLNSVGIITFHDGFSYFAQYYGLHILSAVEEESGAEASAAELKEMITMVKEHQLPAIFVEKNGSDSAASIIAAETDAAVFTLDMAMSGSWFDAMYHNIDTIKEALG
jgi:zinc transport system substrate-binding protein